MLNLWRLEVNFGKSFNGNLLKGGKSIIFDLKNAFYTIFFSSLAIYF